MDGYSIWDTAQYLNISFAFASRIYSSNKKNIPVNKGGRPRKILAKTVEFLKLNLKCGTLKTEVQAKDLANKLLSQSVSVTTVKRQLREAGLIAKKSVKSQTLKKTYFRSDSIY
jgi:transposase